jgi:hypothetical protein
MSNEQVPETQVPAPAPEAFVELLPDTPPDPPVDKEITIKQSALDNLIKSRQSAALKRAAGLEKELQLLKEKMIGGSVDASELEKTRGDLASSRIEAESLRQKQIDSARDLLISEHSTEFFDLDTIRKLTRSNLQHDGKGFVVVNDDGTPRLNAAGEPMTVKEVYSAFADAKPWLARPQVTPGQGSKPSTGYPLQEPDWKRFFSNGQPLPGTAQELNALAMRPGGKQLYDRMKQQSMRRS